MIDPGDADCTTGLSGEIYDAWTGDTSRNGFVANLAASALGDVRPILRSLVWSFAQKIAAEVNVEGLAWRGAWSALTAYSPHDVVRYASAAYVCTLATTAGTLPTDTAHWAVLADAPPAGGATLGSATPQAVGTAAVGTSAYASHEDHVHAHGNQAGGTLHPVATSSVAGFMAGADRTKLDGLPSSAVPTSRVLTAGAGLTGGGDLSADRTFDVGAGAGISVAADAVAVIYGAAGELAAIDAADAASAGTLDKAARADHQHAVDTGAAGTIAIADTAAEGTATTLARSDHRHALPAPAAPATVAAANATGTATAPARADHVHDHGALLGGDRHAVATKTVAGFESAADKSWLDYLAAVDPARGARGDSDTLARRYARKQRPVACSISPDPIVTVPVGQVLSLTLDAQYDWIVAGNYVEATWFYAASIWEDRYVGTFLVEAPESPAVSAQYQTPGTKVVGLRCVDRSFKFDLNSSTSPGGTTIHAYLLTPCGPPPTANLTASVVVPAVGSTVNARFRWGAGFGVNDYVYIDGGPSPSSPGGTMQITAILLDPLGSGYMMWTLKNVGASDCVAGRSLNTPGGTTQDYHRAWRVSTPGVSTASTSFDSWARTFAFMGA